MMLGMMRMHTPSVDVSFSRGTDEGDADSVDVRLDRQQLRADDNEERAAADLAHVMRDTDQIREALRDVRRWRRLRRRSRDVLATAIREHRAALERLRLALGVHARGGAQ